MGKASGISHEESNATGAILLARRSPGVNGGKSSSEERQNLKGLSKNTVFMSP
jgi:hypothetical protein